MLNRRTDCSDLSSAQDTDLRLTRLGVLRSLTGSGIFAAAAAARSFALRWSVIGGRGPPSLVSVKPTAAAQAFRPLALSLDAVEAIHCRFSFAHSHLLHPYQAGWETSSCTSQSLL